VVRGGPCGKVLDDVACAEVDGEAKREIGVPVGEVEVEHRLAARRERSATGITAV